jgi:hypothetical protein
MCGEFFMRYNHLRLDDEDEGNDTVTRVASSCLFVIGIVIQVGVIIHLTNKKIKDGLEKFFNKRKININYIGFDKKSKFIKHGGLCNYAAPVEYLLGQKTTMGKLKKYIIRYFDNQIKICIAKS